MKLILQITLCFSFLNGSGQHSLSYYYNLIQNPSSSDETSLAYRQIIEYYSLVSIDSSIYFSNEFVKYADVQDDINQQIISRCLLASFYEDASLYNTALEWSLEAMKLAESHKSGPKIVATIHQNLGWIYDNLGDVDRAIFHFRNAVKLAEIADDVSLLAYGYYCIGSDFLFNENPSKYDSAIIYLELANDLIQSSSASFDSIVNIETELGFAYAFVGDIENAEKALSKLDEKYDQMGPYHQGYTDAARYHVLKAKGKYEDALKGFQRLLAFTTSMGLANTEESINLLKEILDISKLLRMDSLTYQTYDELRKREMKWLEIQKANRTKELQIQYETAEKEQTLLYQSQQLRQKNLIIYIISGSILIVIFGLCITFYLFQKIKRKNRQIETLMRELHHRVKNNLQVISSLLGLQSSKLSDINAQKAVEEGKERIRAMSLIHQKLYQQSDISSVNIKEYLETLVLEICDSYGFKDKVAIEIDVPEVPMDVDISMPLGLIVNELVSNTFKYAFNEVQQPLLSLEMNINATSDYQVVIKDNGKGLPPDFDIERASSFGLKLVKLLVQQLRGKLAIDQSDGLAFSITFQTVK